MAKLLLDYTVLDQAYTHGKLQFITGDDGAPAANVANPVDTNIDDIEPYTDEDPEIFSYMGGSGNATPRGLLCNVTTNFSTTPATSTGKYTVCTPTASGSTFAWAITGTKDIQLMNNSVSPAVPAAGNPYGVAQVGNFLYIVEYDSAKIYTLNIANFEASTAATYNVDAVTDASTKYPVPVGAYSHGAALLSLTDSSDDTTYLYGLFTVATVDGSGYPDVYSSSVIVRYEVDTATGALSNPIVVQVGANATALVPAPNGTGGIAILVPAIGGKQQYGTTNGPASVLSVVPAFDDFANTSPAPIAFTGDAAGSVSPTGTYDIRGVAVSEDGSYAYLLTATYSASYLTNWRLYSATVADILGASSQPLSTATVLTDVDSTADPDNGDPGYYWEVQYENNATVANGRLWFVKGSPIRISLGSNYDKNGSTYKQIDAGSGGPLYSPQFNVNSADLIGEMIYQASKGVSKDTRLVKGTARQTAQAAQAVQTAQAASEETEEK
jgi:hypothetical protein